MTLQRADDEIRLPEGLVGDIPDWSRGSAADLYATWVLRFGGDEEDATARAVWVANKLVKLAARSTRVKFYSIKHEFVRRHADVGFLVREEVWACHHCVEGVAEDGEGCQHCDGTGVYRSRSLYSHRFEVAGTVYRLHAFVPPRVLLPPPEGDKVQEGFQLTKAEVEALALPLSGFLKLLGYVAAAQWKMRFEGDRYLLPGALPEAPGERLDS